jgi:hypothetical protein
MEKREIKFNAWVPALKIMLYNVTLYADGMLGYDEDLFKESLLSSHKIIDSAVYDKYDEPVLDFLLGEDWVWLEKSEYIPLEFSSFKSDKGEEIFEGDIIDKKFKWTVCFEDGAFYANNEYGKAYLLKDIIKKRIKAGCPIYIIGNIYQNKNF